MDQGPRPGVRTAPSPGLRRLWHDQPVRRAVPGGRRRSSRKTARAVQRAGRRSWFRTSCPIPVAAPDSAPADRADPGVPFAGASHHRVMDAAYYENLGGQLLYGLLIGLEDRESLVRGTRTSPLSARTRTSANCAPKACIANRLALGLPGSPAVTSSPPTGTTLACSDARCARGLGCFFGRFALAQTWHGRHLVPVRATPRPGPAAGPLVPAL